MWRELYSEKMVVAEERRLRVDDSPMGKYQVTRDSRRLMVLWMRTSAASFALPSMLVLLLAKCMSDGPPSHDATLND